MPNSIDIKEKTKYRTKVTVNGKLLWYRQTHNKDRTSSEQKYDIKTSNCEKRRAQVQDNGSAFGIKRPAT